MKPDEAIKIAVVYFAIILVGSLLAAVVGGGFGALVAKISPELVDGLFSPDADASIVRYSLAVGMIWGLFIGGGASGFACLLSAIIKILRIRLEYKKKN